MQIPTAEGFRHSLITVWRLIDSSWLACPSRTTESVKLLTATVGGLASFSRCARSTICIPAATALAPFTSISLWICEISLFTEGMLSLLHLTGLGYFSSIAFSFVSDNFFENCLFTISANELNSGLPVSSLASSSCSSSFSNSSSDPRINNVSSSSALSSMSDSELELCSFSFCSALCGCLWLFTRGTQRLVNQQFGGHGSF